MPKVEPEPHCIHFDRETGACTFDVQNGTPLLTDSFLENEQKLSAQNLEYDVIQNAHVLMCYPAVFAQLDDKIIIDEKIGGMQQAMCTKYALPKKQ